MREIYSNTHWIDHIEFDKSGYFQKCASCSWIGHSYQDLDACHKCGGALDEAAVLALGGLIVACIFNRFYLLDHDRQNRVLVDCADAAEVAAFMVKRIKS
jgi:hypothetical protein